MNDEKGKKIHYKQAEWQEFARFCAMPKKSREKEYGYWQFKTFAEKHDMSNETLTDWRKEEEFWQEVNKNRKIWFKDKTPEVIQALYRTILKDGKASEVMAWFKLIEEYTEKIEGDFTVNKYKQLTLKQLKQQYAELEREQQEGDDGSDDSEDGAGVEGEEREQTE